MRTTMPFSKMTVLPTVREVHFSRDAPESAVSESTESGGPRSARTCSRVMFSVTAPAGVCPSRLRLAAPVCARSPAGGRGGGAGSGRGVKKVLGAEEPQAGPQNEEDEKHASQAHWLIVGRAV